MGRAILGSPSSPPSDTSIPNPGMRLSTSDGRVGWGVLSYPESAARGGGVGGCQALARSFCPTRLPTPPSGTPVCPSPHGLARSSVETPPEARGPPQPRLPPRAGPCSPEAPRNFPVPREGSRGVRPCPVRSSAGAHICHFDPPCPAPVAPAAPLALPRHGFLPPEPTDS